MFGRRPDGKRVKHLDGLYPIIPMIMRRRSDSSNLITLKVDLEPLNTFIKEQLAETGINYTYTEIICAAFIRTLCLKPDLNRFVVNSRIYQRNCIQLSLALQKSLRAGQESNESCFKISFTGKECINDIHEKFENAIKECKNPKSNGTDNLVKALTMPAFIMSPIVGFIKWLDKHGCLPNKMLDLIPFHTSFFLTDMKSIKLPALHHHLYDFGNTTQFLSTSAIEKELYLDKDGTVKERPIMHLGVVTDERICDGYYYSMGQRLFQRILQNPKVLATPLKDEEVPLTSDQKWEKEHKEMKEKAKAEKKAAKAQKKNK